MKAPLRPALKGLQPPPFKEGMRVFEQVLQSLRVRPGAFAPGVLERASASNAAAPPVQAPAATASTK
jgi:hypothetical protein